MTPAKRHLIYAYLLYYGLTLYLSDARVVAKKWYGYQEVDDSVYSEIYFDGVRSVPDDIFSKVVLSEMKKKLDPSGIAGFYFQDGLWRLNIDPSRGQLLKPYRTSDRLICGLHVYKNTSDRRPRSLSSRDLPCGAAPEPYELNEPERILA